MERIQQAGRASNENGVGKERNRGWRKLEKQREREREREKGKEKDGVAEELQGKKKERKERKRKEKEREERVEWRSTRLYSSSASIQFSCSVPRILALSRIFAGIWFTHKIFTLPEISLEFPKFGNAQPLPAATATATATTTAVATGCCNANSRRVGPSK